jgi:uncharacterized membrane protein YkoI
MPAVRVLFEGEEVQVVPLEGDVAVVGRQDDAQVHINNIAISRHHARLVRQGTGHAVEDLGSANGVFVNGEQVERHVLHHKDVITLGLAKYEIVYDAHADASGAANAQANAAAEASSSADDMFDGALHTMTMDGKDLRKQMENYRPEHDRQTAAVPPKTAAASAASAKPGTVTDVELRARQAEIDMLKRELSRTRIYMMIIALVAVGAVLAAVFLPGS